jgi:deoxyribodipyrimidine photo-lyase
MQRAQRSRSNHALEYAASEARRLGLPLLVGFGLMPAYPGASSRHYRFMLEGLAETADDLRKRGIAFVLRIGEPTAVAIDLARHAALVVCDRAYLAHLRQWRYELARTVQCRVVEVETELIVPVEVVSQKAEYAARTIRPKIHRKLGAYLVPLPEDGDLAHLGVPRDPDDRPVRGEDLADIDALLSRLRTPDEPGSVSRFHRGGASEAHARLERFLSERIADYEEQKSEPGLDVSTTLSPYLHFGQISSLEIAIAVGADQFVAGLEGGQGEMKLQPGSVGMRTDSETVASARDALLEELLVRRGLAFNYTWFTPQYDEYSALPGWARSTLEDHASDSRPVTYSLDQLLACETHDEHWNNAMREMLTTGYMHNYMRMYWGKKILEWTDDPAEAFERVRDLNDTWFLDGRDPNSYANVGWVFGLHDRPWTEREIFGKVRYMNARGLERKFDMAAYTLKVRRLQDQE